MSDAPASFTFLALGDSYTLGEGVDPFAAWPHQLRRALQGRGIDLEPPVLIARTGWTTDELADAIEAAQIKGCFDLVTLSAGVNNQYRGRDLAEFRRQFTDLLERSTAYADGVAQHVLVPSIPDWSHSPYAKKLGRDRRQVTREINAFNAAMQAAAEAAGARWLDITDTTRGDDAADYAPDGLHPSASVYAYWVTRMEPLAAEILARPCPH